MLLVVEIAMLIGGIVALATGKMTLIKNKRYQGAAVRIAGLIMLLPIPIALGVGFLWGLSLASQGRSLDADSVRGTLILMELGIVFGCLVVALALAATFGESVDVAEERRRRRRRYDDDDYDDLRNPDELRVRSAESLRSEAVQSERSPRSPVPARPSRRVPSIRREFDDPAPPPRSLGTGAIVAIIIGCFLFVGAVGAVGWATLGRTYPTTAAPRKPINLGGDDGERKIIAEKEAAVRRDLERRRIEEERKREEDERRARETEEAKKAPLRKYAATLDAADRQLQLMDAPRAAEMLDGLPPESRGWEWRYLRAQCGPNPGPEPVVLKPARGTLRGIALSPDGGQLAAVQPDGNLIVFDARTGKERYTKKAHAMPANSVAWSPDGKRLATVAGNPNAQPVPPGEVKLWNAETGEEMGKLEGHSAAVVDVAWSPNGTRIAAAVYRGPRADANKNCQILLWDVATRAKVFAVDASYTVHISFSPDGARLLASGRGQNRRFGILIWDALDEKGAVRDLTQGVQGLCSSLAVGANDRAAVTDTQGHLHVFDTATGEPILHLDLDKTDRFPAVAIGQDGKRIVVGDKQGTLTFWDLPSGQQVFALKGPDQVTKIAFSRNGDRLVATFGSPTTGASEVRIWDANPPNGK